MPTIQGAIDLASTGDTILVGAGTYLENIDFLGKGITVQSEFGPDETTIDGNQIRSVVSFRMGEGRSSVLAGFTIRNGLGGGINVNGSPTIRDNKIIENRGALTGGGIHVRGGDPLIEDNVISANYAGSGSGIWLSGSSAVVRQNVITSNYQSPSTGGASQGGGVFISGAGSAQILDNLIANNSIGTDGGGIAMNAAGSPIIRGNIIRENHVTSGNGGGINLSNRSDALIVQNLIVGNQARGGAGVAWLTPSGARGPILVSNTIVDNFALGTALRASGILANGFDEDAALINNVIVASPGQTAVFLAEFNDTKIPHFSYNNAYSVGGSAYAGLCCEPTGSSGNLSVDPMFADANNGNYALSYASPLIDRGDNDAPGLTLYDILGNPRFVDGNHDQLPVIDMGAFEVVPELSSLAQAVLGIFALLFYRRYREV